MTHTPTPTATRTATPKRIPLDSSTSRRCVSARCERGVKSSGRRVLCSRTWASKCGATACKCAPCCRLGCVYIVLLSSRTSVNKCATHCSTLQHTEAHCNTLQHTVTLCNTRQHSATRCNTLQHTATRCSTLQHTAAHCSALQHSATHCSTLQHPATHYNTLQHTATHCSTHLSWLNFGEQVRRNRGQSHHLLPTRLQVEDTATCFM